MRRLLPTTIAAVALAATLGTRQAQAAPIIGAQLFATGGDVIATFLGHTAGFSNDLYLFAAGDLITPLPVTGVVGPGTPDPGLIFNNQTTPVGTQINLGSFAAGTELVFGIFVRNTGDWFFMGPGVRNPDGLPHGAVDDGSGTFPIYGVSPPGSVRVGFEDLFGGGDLDYDDLGFAFSNVTTAVPEPGTMMLLGLGLLGRATMRARRRLAATGSGPRHRSGERRASPPRHQDSCA
jgi:hypothetical protein